MFLIATLISGLTVQSDKNHPIFPFTRHDCRTDVAAFIGIKRMQPRKPTRLPASLQSKDKGSSSGDEQYSNQSFTLVPADRPSEWNHVADLRYNEWIANKFTTSREAFRLATLEICEERCSQGAMIFVAKDAHSSEVLGAAEASPIEMNEAKLPVPSKAETHDDVEIVDFYVTDVITAERHRRKGVARILVQALETKADYLWLHVTADNLAAQKFYKAMGYEIYPKPDQYSSRIDVGKLEKVSCASSQVLMRKKC